jgi:pyruvate,orthophosphate dikinase
MVKEKLIDEKTALKRIPASDLTQLLLPYFAASDKKASEVVTKGIGASPGAATGKLAFTAAEAVERAKNGEKVLLVRKETSPEDVAGMHSADGILTSTGGKTSHAAVVAVGWGKCCVVGAGELSIDEKAGKLFVNGRTFGRNDVLSIDGSTGEVMVGSVTRTVPEKPSGEFAKIMDWSTKYASMKVRTNADSPEDARRARDFGAVGIGLCRTEHMFFGGDRTAAIREMILSETTEAREKALAKLLPFQRADFHGIFTAMDGLPVTVRLLDPPLHEFVPHEEAQQRELAKEMGLSLEQVQRRVKQLHEANPMLGHRGCRLSITYPEILRMQIRAIVEAAIDCRAKKIDARPEIMHPLVGTKKELALLRKWTEETIAQVCSERGVKMSGKNGLEIPIGTMIEIPRAAVTADEIGECADFFSFGTNDLTQMTFGYSRDDIGSFLPAYLEKGMLEKDPFQSIDTVGVGGLVKMACEKGRAVAKAEKKAFKLGVCGEHGGDPSSIAFFQKCGLDYVSCSPFRVPVDRKDQAKQNHRPLHKVQGPVRFARTSTSAERSEARGGDVEQSAMYRVASPLVMARLTSRVDSQRSNCIVVGTRASSHYLLLCRGVVPHETTIDSAVNCSGSAPLRLRQSLIWAPPEGAAAAATATSLSARARLLPRPRSGQLPSE